MLYLPTLGLNNYYNFFSADEKKKYLTYVCSDCNATTKVASLRFKTFLIKHKCAYIIPI